MVEGLRKWHRIMVDRQCSNLVEGAKDMILVRTRTPDSVIESTFCWHDLGERSNDRLFKFQIHCTRTCATPLIWSTRKCPCSIQERWSTTSPRSRASTPRARDPSFAHNLSVGRSCCRKPSARWRSRFFTLGRQRARWQAYDTRFPLTLRSAPLALA